MRDAVIRLYVQFFAFLECLLTDLRRHTYLFSLYYFRDFVPKPV